MKGKACIIGGSIAIASILFATLSWGAYDSREGPHLVPMVIGSGEPHPVRLLEEPPSHQPLDANQMESQRMNRYLYEAQGVLLAAGKNTQRIGPLRLQSYRLEEVSLPRPQEVQVRGKTAWADKAWRLTVTGGPFTVRAMPVVIWVGDAILGVGQESPNLSSVAAVTFDASLLFEGATISLSYGEHGPRMELPEKLTFVGQRR